MDSADSLFFSVLSIYNADNELSSNGLKKVSGLYETNCAFKNIIDAKIAADEDFSFWCGVRKREPVIIQRTKEQRSGW